VIIYYFEIFDVIFYTLLLIFFIYLFLIINNFLIAILEEINYKLTYEDQTLRTFRRAIGFGQNVRSPRKCATSRVSESI